jgi:lactoylglutathione lyase
MHITHIALWTSDLERARRFYETYFNATANQKYSNPRKQFESYFLAFENGARLELMHSPTLSPLSPAPALGYAHLAMSVGSPENVDALTIRLRADGYTIVDGPRTTGDGYYESVVLDADGNRIEITI